MRLPRFEVGEGRDVLLVELEIANRKVLLDVPAGDDLRRRAAMFCRDLATTGFSKSVP